MKSLITLAMLVFTFSVSSANAEECLFSFADDGSAEWESDCESLSDGEVESLLEATQREMGFVDSNSKSKLDDESRRQLRKLLMQSK